jgi:hypothetical protein
MSEFKEFNIINLNSDLNLIIRKYVLLKYTIWVNLHRYITIKSDLYMFIKKEIKKCGGDNIRTLAPIEKRISVFICEANIDVINRLRTKSFVESITNDNVCIDLCD